MFKIGTEELAHTFLYLQIKRELLPKLLELGMDFNASFIRR